MMNRKNFLNYIFGTGLLMFAPKSFSKNNEKNIYGKYGKNISKYQEELLENVRRDCQQAMYSTNGNHYYVDVNKTTKKIMDIARKYNLLDVNLKIDRGRREIQFSYKFPLNTGEYDKNIYLFFPFSVVRQYYFDSNNNFVDISI